MRPFEDSRLGQWAKLGRPPRRCAHAHGLAQHDLGIAQVPAGVDLQHHVKLLSPNIARPSSRLSWITLTPRCTQASTLASSISTP